MTGLTDMARQDYKVMKVSLLDWSIRAWQGLTYVVVCRILQLTPGLPPIRGRLVSGSLWTE